MLALWTRHKRSKLFFPTQISSFCVCLNLSTCCLRSTYFHRCDRPTEEESHEGMFYAVHRKD